ncbi:unnamed protein product [Caenorhabditis bovis]|uniref:PCI domain-containing protein n=1 Tax=Caenorhabditis bovis TaxID=2654633 RepID=A0A8S1ETP1_9PELO|nr:unnamed protein product [Caenorhabditis bovis]
MSATALSLKAVQHQVSLQNEKSSEDDVKSCEYQIITFAKQLAAEKDAAGIQNLLIAIRPFYDVVGKARASKLIRELVECSLSIEQAKDEKIALLKHCIDWATENHREFLRRNLKARLARLYNDVREYTEALKLAHELGIELKKMEDRELLIELSLEESKSAFYLNNFTKAKCALVTAKTNANAAFVTPSLQASIDLQSGILYSADEKDFKTSFSYFYEAFEGYNGVNDKANAIRAVKYMILAKIMLNESDQIPALLATKEMASMKGREIDAIRAMSDAFRIRCLKSFQEALRNYKSELVEDKVVAVHSHNLEKRMVEKEISRVIEPYSEIGLPYIARVIGMPVHIVEKAVARMILDKKLSGCIDQHVETVIIHPKASTDKPFKRSLTTIREVSKAVDASYDRAARHIK